MKRAISICIIFLTSLSYAQDKNSKITTEIKTTTITLTTTALIPDAHTIIENPNGSKVFLKPLFFLDGIAYSVSALFQNEHEGFCKILKMTSTSNSIISDEEINQAIHIDTEGSYDDIVPNVHYYEKITCK